MNQCSSWIGTSKITHLPSPPSIQSVPSLLPFSPYFCANPLFRYKEKGLWKEFVEEQLSETLVVPTMEELLLRPKDRLGAYRRAREFYEVEGCAVVIKLHVAPELADVESTRYVTFFLPFLLCHFCHFFALVSAS